MKYKLLTLALASTFALSACGGNDAAAPADTAATPDAAMPAETAPPADAAPASANPMVGGVAMDAGKDIVANASAAPNLSTLVAAVTAAGLVETLQGAGPFTVFAPTDDAFSALPAGTVEGLLKPEAKADLTGVLTYHVVPGNVDAATLTQQITAGGGEAKLTTVQGAVLTAKADNGTVTLTDAKGNVATVTTADVKQSNGVVHVIDKVLLP